MNTNTQANDNRALLKRALLKLEELQTKLDRLHEPIAVIGLSCRFPGGANDPDALWEILRDKSDAISEVPLDRWRAEDYYDPNPGVPGKMYCRQGGFLDAVDRFDPHFFGISPREALKMDPQQRLLLEVAWEALERAGQAPLALAESLTGVFVGIGGSDYAHLQTASGDPRAIDTYFAAGASHSIASGRISYLLGLRGPSLSVDTACSSSLLAVHLACQSLRLGECHMALAGGVNLILGPNGTIAACQTRMLAADGRCKTFDASADGYVRSEGCALVVLKRLSDATSDGDNILAVIRGTAANQDGRSNGLTAPNGAAQEAVIRDALANAAVKPGELSYVEAHGTGTSLGDPIEVQALAAVFGEDRPAGKPLFVGAVKSNIGHLEAAAGIAGLVKVILALQHDQIPATLHVRNLNPHIAWNEIPVKIVTDATPWPTGGKRLAGVSSFGFSGTNVHVVIEEPPAPPSGAPPRDDRPLHVLALSAKSEPALAELASRFARALPALPPSSVADVCFTANTGRSHFQHRLAAVAATTQELSANLAAFAGSESRHDVRNGTAAVTEPLQIAFLFTGQGAQYPGMGRALFETEPTFREALEKCDALLRSCLDRPLLSILYPESTEPPVLDQTCYAQPALFALEYALAELWKSWGIVPAAVLGHSVGEYAAACSAGVLNLEDGLQLITERGRLMQSMAADGAMAVIFADEETTAAAIAGLEKQLAIAAINGPENTVVSGNRQALSEVLANLGSKGVAAKRLAVSQAFHSPLLDPILDRFEDAAARIAYARPRIGYVSNVTGRFIGSDDVIDGRYWSRHAREPVQFGRGVESLHQRGCGIFLEIGPDATLCAMGRRSLPDFSGRWLSSLSRAGDDWRRILESLAELYVSGATVDWAQFDKHGRRRRINLPTYPFQRNSYWSAPAATLHLGTSRLSQHSASKHPLLGEYTHLAHPAVTRVWESVLDGHVLTYLDHHRVQGAAVVAAAVYIEMVVAAAREVMGDGPFTLSDVEFLKPLVLADDVRHVLQLIFSAAGERKFAFHVYSRRPDERADGPWTLHVSGTVSAEADDHISTLPRVDIEAIQERCPDVRSGAEFYRVNEARGNQWGPLHQGIDKVWRAEREALARVRVPQTLEQELKNYWFHPAVADACGQVLAATMRLDHPGDGARCAFVGGGFHRARILKSPRGLQLWSYGRLRDDGQDRDVVEGDIWILDEAGEMVAELAGVRYRYLDGESRPRIEDQVEDWFYDLQWRGKVSEEPAESDDGRRAPDGCWLILADNLGVGKSLGQLLHSAGTPPIIAFAGDVYGRSPDGSFIVSPKSREDMERLLDEAFSQGIRIEKIVHLWSLDAPSFDEPSADWLDTRAILGCASVLHLIQVLAATDRSHLPQLWLVTQGGQRVGVEDGPPCLLQSPLWGFGRAVAQEHAELWGGLIDLDPTSGACEAAQHLKQEIERTDGEDQVALRKQGRYVARLTRKARVRAARPVRFDPKAGYLITGGLGGLGLTVSQWMIERGARCLILLGRTKLPPRSLWDAVEEGRTARQIAAIKEMEAAGATVHVAAIDVADRFQLESWLTAYRQDGGPGIRGIFHAAGVMQYEPLLQHDIEKMSAVFRAKVLGGWLLHRLFENIPLDFFVLFSSAASLLSSPLMSSYAAANAFLDALAHYRRFHGLAALSINWGSWSEVGMATNVNVGCGRAIHGGMNTLTPPQGLGALERLLEQDSAQAGVIPMDWGRLQEISPTFARSRLFAEVIDESNSSGASSGADLICAMLADAASDERESLLRSYLAERLAEVLGLPASAFDVYQPISTLGFDSLMAVEIKNRIEADLGIVIPIVRFLQGPSVADLAAIVLVASAAQEGAPSGTSGQTNPSAVRNVSPIPDGAWEEGEI